MPDRKALDVLVRNRIRAFLLVFSCAGLLLTGCSAGPDTGGAPDPANAPRVTASPRGQAGAQVKKADAGVIRGLGPVTSSRVPAGTRQALVVTGAGVDSSIASAVLYQRETGRPWAAVAGPWPAHNALRGWTDDHVVDDLRSPVGVFSLGDAGGRLPNPGTKLPYDQDEQFTESGIGFLGESLEGSFNYVVAIDYNRIPGTSPLDRNRPEGEEKGGGIWVHVDHGGPTRACVSLEQPHMVDLLLRLDPARNPVIVMGDVASLMR
ncbi:hypothetical protein [Streptomyces sp. AM8-1-1]|uniref:hypothetical protein n=1 Tax=Streptomyces sp. AM8-1-1 TaxID=3075825 RepID=UPI0028C45DD0|nr:hypothetical protein [Streptomyces sp. AM8-1-1]WNO71579.1 hypothetical protein RPQ07_08005 [Streptomyces sp. AM8-1-1]